MTPAAIIEHTGIFIWPLLIISLWAWYLTILHLFRKSSRQKGTTARETYGTLGTVASSVGLMGSAYGLAVTLVGLGSWDPQAITQTMGVAVCSTIVGTAVAISCVILGLVVEAFDRRALR